MPNIAEIKRMSADMLASERVGADRIKETTPAESSLGLEAFCLSLGGAAPMFVPVVDDEHGLFGWCSDGVLEKVKADGGEIVFGWSIWEWPEVLRTAEFHAVWKSPAGELMDITPKPRGEQRILFVQDDSYPRDFNFDHRPGNRRQRAYVAPDKVEMAKQRIDALKPHQIEYETKRAQKAGMSLQQWFEAKVPEDKLTQLIDEMISACDAHEEYFDSLGASGEVYADARLRQLLRRRAAAQIALTAAVTGK